MLTIEQISGYFPEPLIKKNPQGILVEYLQYELMDSLFKNKQATALSFIGGTAIRMLFNSHRFSEDLDFDNFELSFTQFEQLLEKACRDMEYKGFLIEFKIVERGAYHCYIRFPEILYKSGISSNAKKKILIRVDSEKKEKFYQPQVFMLNKFTVFRRILTASAPVLLSQKMITVLLRKREKGRDLFDVSFLLGLAEPDFSYIEKSLNVGRKEFIRSFTERISSLDLNFLSKDVEPFLFEPELKERIVIFKDYWEQQGNSSP